MKIKILKAFDGDAILISFKDLEGKNRNILIDGGPPETYESYGRKNDPGPKDLQLTIENIKNKGEKIDLLILTHVDEDHIGGIVHWFEEDKESSNVIGKIWFNSGRLISEYFIEKENKEHLIPLRELGGKDTSIRQGVYLEDFIEKHNIWDRKIIKDKIEILEFGIRFKVLSPNLKNLKTLLKRWKEKAPDTTTTGGKDYKSSLKELIEEDKFKEDNSPHNASSIALLLTHNSKNILMLGDAYASTVKDGLKYFGFSKENPLKAELVKVSHHGSKANTDYELLSYIDSDKFIISTDGQAHKLPNKRCLARIINSKPGVSLYFNYPDLISEIFSSRDREEFQFSTFSCDEEFIL